MEKKLLEVEGDEMAIFSTKGIMAIIPKNKVNWVKKKLNEGCHECVDSLVQGLPNFDEDGQTAEDGVMLDVDQQQDQEQELASTVDVPVEAPKSQFRIALDRLNPNPPTNPPTGGPIDPVKGVPTTATLSFDEWMTKNPKSKIWDLTNQEDRNKLLKENMGEEVKSRYLDMLNKSLNSNYTWDNLPNYVCFPDENGSLSCGVQKNISTYSDEEVGQKIYNWRPKEVIETIPQKQPSTETAKQKIGEINREIRQVRETQNSQRAYSTAVQEANPNMSTSEYATEVRIGTDIYPVRHSNENNYGEVIIDGKTKYITYRKIDNGSEYGYEPVLLDIKPITF